MPQRTSAEILDRVHAVINAVQFLREEMLRPAADPVTGLAVRKVPAEDTRSLKSAIDEFRLFLWAYMDAWDVNGCANPKSQLQRIRIRAVTDMLRLLMDDFRRDGVPSTQDVEDLLGQIRAMAVLVESRARL